MTEETISAEVRPVWWKRIPKKAIVVGILVLILAGMWIFDAIRAQTFRLEMVECTPEIAIADGKTKVEITYRLTRWGKPVEGHNIFVYCDGNGRFFSYREQTDADGKVTFLLYPGRATIYSPAEDIPVYASDESNSVFIMVKAKNEFVLPVTSE